MSSVTVFTASHEGLAVICEATSKFKARPCDPWDIQGGFHFAVLRDGTEGLDDEIWKDAL